MDKVQNTKIISRLRIKTCAPLVVFLTSILYGDQGYMNILNIVFNIYFHNNYKC